MRACVPVPTIPTERVSLRHRAVVAMAPPMPVRRSVSKPLSSSTATTSPVSVEIATIMPLLDGSPLVGLS
ncbi:hypothetical protein D9M68_217460 [compost metagenome]